MNRQILGNGTSQQDRNSPALEDGYFDVDEMRFEDLLSMAVDYSRILKFYDLNNEADGDWAPFFSSDEAVIIAQILTTDLHKIESEFFTWVDRDASLFRDGADISEYDLDNIPAYQLAKTLDVWLNELQFNQLRTTERDEAQDLGQRIARLIDGKLKVELDSLTTFLNRFNIESGEKFAQDLSGIWFEIGDQTAMRPVVPPPYADGAGRERIERFLRLNFYSFYHAVSFLQANSEDVLNASLVNGMHSPDVGLYIAFLKIFQRAQQKANLFTQKHLNFYYYDVLKVQRRHSLPDSAYLILKPDVADRKVLVQEGTEFVAGVDENNQDVIYTADNDLLVTDANVASLLTLYFEREPLKSPEHELEYISGAKSNQIPVLAGTVTEEDSDMAAWPLLGAPKIGLDQSLEESEAEIGFAIASPVLFLKEGGRTINLTFKTEFIGISRFSIGDFKDITSLAAKLREATDAISQHVRECFSDEFRQQLESYDGTSPMPEQLQRALVDELNRLLFSDSLYDSETFQQQSLSQATQNLVERYSGGPIPRRFNRLLLEEAYPDEIAKNDYLESLLENLADISRYSSREDAFFKTFASMFTIRLTMESGWYEVPEYLPLSHVVDENCARDELKIQIDLPPEVEAVVPYSRELHGGDYGTELPLIRFMVNPRSYMYPYSLLSEIVMEQIEIEVEVTGVRDVLLYNNLGQLDPNNPFNPFGPIPSVGSFLIVGNAEIARKDVTHFEVDIEWGDLPREVGGFQEYYEAYDMTFNRSIFGASVSVLRDGKWTPPEERDQPEVSLFESGESNELIGQRYSLKQRRISLGEEVTSFFKPVESITADEDFGYNSLAKNGFFKFTLSSPEYAFGHKDYPQILTQVLTENARLKHPRLFRPIPNTPYTPLINVISVSYKASSTINLEHITSSSEGRFRERIFHVHPFGLQHITGATYRNLNMLPRYQEAGNLFIGLSASEMSGRLTLLFHLREDCAPEAGEEPTESNWYYLSSNQWKTIERSNVISDTTDGFLSTGIVTLNVPNDINTGNTVMPAELLWLRVSVNDHPEYLCSLYSVHTQAMEVTWRARDGSNTRSVRRLPAGTIKEPRVSIPGIGKINQIVDSFGGSPSESPERVKTRLSERLRHKNRALLPWDYERLILERFPNLYMVKCFANMVDDPENPTRPGSILIVVIPDPKVQATAHLQPIVNGLALREIREFAQSLSSPFATIEVRNPAYERIQVRCTVKFARDAVGGHYINALNQAVIDYLSPWNTSGGYGARFGWRIRRYDIESYIRSLEYIDFVTNFSMLHIAEDDAGYFHLFDTIQGRREEDEIRPLFPWSIAIPTRRHFIETTDRFVAIEAEQTGIDELRIGSTFIITSANDTAEANNTTEVNNHGT